MAAPEKLILLVEDSADDVFLFKRVLAKAHLKNPVHAVADIEDAIRYLEGSGTYADRSLFPWPSIAIVDLHLPNKDGFYLLQWLRERPNLAHLNLVVVTGVSRLADMNRAYQMGASSFLMKPVKEEDVRNLARAFPTYWT